MKKTYPHLRLFWVVEDRCAPVLEAHPLLERVIVYPRRRIKTLWAEKKWAELWKEIRGLRQVLSGVRADLSLDLQGLAKSALMVLMSRAPRRWGCTGLKEFSYLLSRSVPEGAGLHAVDRNLKVAEFLGCPAGSPEFSLGLRPEEREWAAAFLAARGVGEQETIIGLQLGASFPQKCWPPEYWRELIERLSPIPGRHLVLFGDQKDQARFREFRPPAGPVTDTLGRLSLRQLMALMERCRLVAGADTGPLHVAVALGVPVVGLYGPDDPRFTGPYGPVHRIHYKNLPCSPCYKQPTCQGRFDCLRAIAAEEVVVSIGEILKADHRGPRSGERSR